MLDASVLISHWWRRSKPASSIAESKAWARELIDLERTKTIASPVRIEYLAGAKNPTALQLALAYIDCFHVVDGGKIPRGDWRDAERIAKRVRKAGQARKLGDCLIEAISNRLKCEIVTRDFDFPRRTPPQDCPRITD